MKKSTHGGARPGASPPLKHPEQGKRKPMGVCLSHSNYAFLKTMKRRKNDYLNYLLDLEREKTQQHEKET